MNEDKRIGIRVSKDFIKKIKQLAINQQMTMNDFCIEMIEIGMKQTFEFKVNLTPAAQIQPTMITSDLVLKVVEKFEFLGLLAILKTEGFTTGHVILFEHGLVPPEKIYHEITESIFALEWINEEWPTRQYWIEIAKVGVILWCRSEVEKEQLQSTLNRWADELISF